MALWPFRRKSGRKRSRSGAALYDVDADGLPRSQTADDITRTSTPPRSTSQKKQRTEQPPTDPETQKKLQRRARTYSFSPGRKDSIRLAAAAQDHATSGLHGPGRPTRFSPEEQIDEETEKDHAWRRVPTLYNARSGAGGTQTSRKKSSKRRREDLDREAEIKAMSTFAPRRPATEPWMAGRPIKKDSKRAKTGLGRNSVPASDVSLPIPESIHSSMSSDSEHASYKVSALDTLAPRPTLRRAYNPRFGPSSTSDPARTASQKRKLMEPGVIPEETLKAHKRIDSLADDLDAHDIRELMERDNRRRERKTQREQERLERRLTRRAAKQREAEEEARKNGTPPPQNLERGVLGREEHGLGIDPESTVRTSSRRRAENRSSAERQETQAEAILEGEVEVPAQEAEAARPQALNHFHRSESIPLDSHEEAHEAKAPATPPPEEAKPNKTADTENKALHSKTSLASDEKRRLSSLPSKSDLSEPGRKDSVASSRGKRTFASLFKWGSIRGNRRSSGPSSFSNTSREEMQAAGSGPVQVPPAMVAIPQSRSAEQVTERSSTATPPVVVAFTPTKMSSSGVPKRTRSRFREDLPELPMSPPDSRVASPDVEPPLPAVTEVRADDDNNNGEEGTAPIPIRYDTPASERRTIDETMRQTPTSLHRNTQNSPQPQSVSLASIDSEASWLSGRINSKRGSSGMGMRDSMSRTTTYAHSQQQRRSRHSSDNDSEEEDLAASDDYLSNLATPSKETYDDHPFGRRSTGEGRPSSDEGDSYVEGDMKWGSVGARQPILHGDMEMIKSREGLLNTVDEAGKSSSEEAETPHLEQATSVDYGRKGHVRHLSAGSAKLLDITPRASIDSKGRSPPPPSSRRGSAPLYI